MAEATAGKEEREAAAASPPKREPRPFPMVLGLTDAEAECVFAAICAVLGEKPPVHESAKRLATVRDRLNKVIDRREQDKVKLREAALAKLTDEERAALGVR